MKSLRTRLTVLYTVSVALMLAVLALVTAQFTLRSLTHPMFDATRESAADARRVIAANPNASFKTLEHAILLAASRPDVTIYVIPRAGIRNGIETRTLLPKSSAFGLFSSLSLDPTFIPLRTGTIVITPDYRRVAPLIGRYIQLDIIGFFVAIVVAWLIARWLASQALGPLLVVTSELARFGDGNFAPRPVTASGLSELNELTSAFNSAARQVAAAFDERERVATELRALLGNAGHALRTPLTVVSGFVDLLAGKSLDDPTLRERAIRSMTVETRRMRLLVEGLMSLARMEQLENRMPMPVDIGVAIEGAIEQVRAARGGDISLHRSGVHVVIAEPTEIHDAVVNLIENAVKYGEGTPVTVDVAQHGTAVQVRVRDAGPGIPEMEQSRIFERFFRGDSRPAVDGSGLGLAIVARAMDRCGGTVSLEHARRGNTSFVLTFKRTPPVSG